MPCARSTASHIKTTSDLFHVLSLRCEIDRQRLVRPVIAKDCEGKTVTCSLQTLQSRLKVAKGRLADPDVSKASKAKDLDRWAGVVEPAGGFPASKLHVAALKVSANSAPTLPMLNSKLAPVPLAGSTSQSAYHFHRGDEIEARARASLEQKGSGDEGKTLSWPDLRDCFETTSSAAAAVGPRSKDHMRIFGVVPALGLSGTRDCPRLTLDEDGEFTPAFSLSFLLVSFHHIPSPRLRRAHLLFRPPCSLHWEGTVQLRSLVLLPPSDQWQHQRQPWTPRPETWTKWQ